MNSKEKAKEIVDYLVGEDCSDSQKEFVVNALTEARQNERERISYYIAGLSTGAAIYGVKEHVGLLEALSKVILEGKYQ